MGWATGRLNGRDVGYGVQAKCDWPGCGEKIDRGLGYRCGGLLGVSLDGDVHHCGGYYCSKHRQGLREQRNATSNGGTYLAPVCNDCAKPPSKRRKTASVFAP